MNKLVSSKQTDVLRRFECSKETELCLRNTKTQLVWAFIQLQIYSVIYMYNYDQYHRQVYEVT